MERFKLIKKAADRMKKDDELNNDKDDEIMEKLNTTESKLSMKI